MGYVRRLSHVIKRTCSYGHGNNTKIYKLLLHEQYYLLDKSIKGLNKIKRKQIEVYDACYIFLLVHLDCIHELRKNKIPFKDNLIRVKQQHIIYFNYKMNRIHIPQTYFITSESKLFIDFMP